MNFLEFKSKYQFEQVEEFENTITENPLVSICVQTYQHSKYIRQCLEGLLMQKTDFSFEILLGEDDSTDGTRDICLEYAKKYPNKIRLFLHHRENNIKILGGATGRFNWCYNLYSSNGKYIALCEGDDYWTDENKLQSQINFLEENKNYSACFTNSRIEQMDDIDVYSENYFSECKDRDIEFQEIALRGGGLYPTAGLVFRNNLTELPSFFPEILSGDRALGLLLGADGIFRLFNKVSCVYRVHSTGIFSGNILNRDTRIKTYQNNIKLLNVFDVSTDLKFHKEIKNAISLQSKKILVNSKFGFNTNLFKNLTFKDFISYVKNISFK